MKVYTAGPFAWRDRLSTFREELIELGIEVTSRWLDEKSSPTSSIFDHDEEYLRSTAYVDLQDIVAADVIVLFTPYDEDFSDLAIVKRAWARGGRHFEFGFAYAWRQLSFVMTGRETPELIICGPRENVFSYLHEIKQFSTWSQVKTYLLERSQLAKAAEKCARTN